MSEIDRVRWQNRHAGAEPAQAPSAFLMRVLPGVPRGRALDLAAGGGRNALFLARSGFAVEALDISGTALDRLAEAARREGLTTTTVEADLDEHDLPADRYDLVVNVRYLQRSLLPAIERSLVRGGHLVFETFLTPQRRSGHPRNPEYLLRPGELPASFHGMEVLEYEEGLVAGETGNAWLARLWARRR